MGAPTTAAVPDHLRAGELGQAPSPAGPVRWPVSVGFSWGLAALALALIIATTVIAVADGDVLIILLVPGQLAATLMGGLVAVRRPGQPMGMLLCAYGISGAVCASIFAYAHAAIVHFPGSLPAGRATMWITSWDYVLPITLQALVLPLVFPDGRLLSRRWRPALWAAVAFALLSTVGNAFDPGSMGGWFANRPNPYAVRGPLFSVILDVANVCGLAVAVAAAASVALRWRRGGHMVRQQLKWFLATVPVTVALVVVVQFFPDAATLSLVRGAVPGVLTAVAIGLAVLLPVRGRLQRRVDRLFYGDRGAPYDALARLGRRVEEAADTESALDASRADLVTMREEERRRLRRDLHDGLGPTLAGLTLGLDTARALSLGQPELHELLGRLKAETQRAVTDVRRVVYGLRPPALDELGLAGALYEEIMRLQCQAPALQVTVEAVGTGLADLPAAVEVACYRIVTEALTNVARHARATRCVVRIGLDHGLDVEVCDDGVGLPEGWRTGVGIASMRERVAELGGDLVIEPSLPRGTRIAACLPMGELP